MSRTALPWHVSGGHAEYVESASRVRVADCQIVQKPFLTLATREMEANAELIVRAVNSYNRLLSTLRDIKLLTCQISRSTVEADCQEIFELAETALTLSAK